MKIIIQLFLMILMLLPTLMQAQPEGDEAKGEFEVIHDYDPNLSTTVSAVPASIIVKTFDAVFNEEEGFVQLRWKLDNKLGAFVIEHSTDGEAYNEIGTVNETSGFEIDYFIFEAREFDPKVNFYRLKQIVNETVIYSNPLNVSVSPNDDEHFLERALKTANFIDKVQHKEDGSLYRNYKNGKSNINR